MGIILGEEKSVVACGSDEIEKVEFNGARQSEFEFGSEMVSKVLDELSVENAVVDINVQ